MSAKRIQEPGQSGERKARAAVRCSRFVRTSPHSPFLPPRRQILSPPSKSPTTREQTTTTNNIRRCCSRCPECTAIGNRVMQSVAPATTTAEVIRAPSTMAYQPAEHLNLGIFISAGSGPNERVELHGANGVPRECGPERVPPVSAPTTCSSGKRPTLPTIVT